ncbi:Intraflagellar transport protein 27 -like protein, partial [Caligus rogercresseyi]
GILRSARALSWHNWSLRGKISPKLPPYTRADLVHKAINIPDTSDAVELEDLYGSFFQELWSSQEIGLVALVYDVSKKSPLNHLGM